MHKRNFYFAKWLDCGLNTLNYCVFSGYCIHQNAPDNCGLAQMIKTQFKQTWYNSIFELSKCLIFRILSMMAMVLKNIYLHYLQI